MPRQDVPYGGAICRLKERIAEIWDELGKKLHSINGVEGDAAGDVKIVSGDAAVVVTSDQVNHEIEIALDSSQLPAAAVSSVNGQTGAVVLDANDIDAGLVPPGTSVAQDLASTKQQLQTVGGLVQQEILDRQNADSTLQGNINAVSASIPGAAATAVANDPTVAQLATDVPNKLDKITSGSSLKAYTHTGATQGETSVVDGTTANSIGVRDANGRMQAADPASGATDKTLVTANWVSQTGDSGPNNLIHKTGNETKTGEFTCCDLNNNRVKLQTSNSNPGWRKVYSWLGGGAFNVIIKGNTGNRRNGDPILVTVAVGDPSQIGNGSTWNELAKIVLGTASTKQVALAYDPNTNMTGFYYYFPPSEATTVEMIGTTSTVSKSIAITPVTEDPTTFTAHVII